MAKPDPFRIEINWKTRQIQVQMLNLHHLFPGQKYLTLAESVKLREALLEAELKLIA